MYLLLQKGSLTFSASQFLMKVFEGPFRLDQNRNRDDIPSRRLLKHVFPSDIERLYIELNFRKCKQLLLRTYHSPSQSDQYYFNNIDKSLDPFSNYENILLVKEFNAQVTDHYLSYRVFPKKVHVLKMFPILVTYDLF